MKISVCIATYNGQEFILEQLNSILNQLEEEDEIIISDDSSNDGTIEKIESLNDSRIILYKNNKFKNPIFNFENAIKKSKGDIIFLSDQDDIWAPNKVSVILKEIIDYTCVLHNAKLVNEKKESLNNDLFDIYKTDTGFMKNIVKNSYVGCCMAFKKEMLKHILPFPKGIPMHDSWIGLISEKYGKVKLVNENLIYYRRHSSNASNTGSKSKRRIIIKLKERIKMIKYLLFR